MKNRLRVLREARKLRQIDVAHLCHITHKAYWQYERHDMLPNVLTAIRIADALGVQDLREIWREEAENPLMLSTLA